MTRREFEVRDDLGLCCACRTARATGFAMLSVRAPVRGTGWGCFVCHLPLDGAVAALCEACGTDDTRPILDVVDGYPIHGKRRPLSECTTPFAHDQAAHARDDARMRRRGVQ